MKGCITCQYAGVNESRIFICRGSLQQTLPNDTCLSWVHDEAERFIREGKPKHAVLPLMEEVVNNRKRMMRIDHICSQGQSYEFKSDKERHMYLMWRERTMDNVPPPMEEIVDPLPFDPLPNLMAADLGTLRGCIVVNER